MKEVTLKINEELLSKVMQITHAKTEEEAIDWALQDAAASDVLKDYFSHGPRLTGQEWADAFYPGYDPKAPDPFSAYREQAAN